MQTYEGIVYGFNNFDFGYSFYLVYKVLYELGVPADTIPSVIPILMLMSFSFAYILMFKTPNLMAFSLIASVFSFVGFDLFFNLYRQGFATPFLILSIYYLNKSHHKAGLLYSIIAIGFHWSCILLYMLWIVSRLFSREQGKILLNVSIFLSVTLFFFNAGITQFLYDIAKHLPLPNEFKVKIDFYLNYVEANYYELNYMGRAIYLIPTLLCLGLVYRLYYLNVNLAKFLTILSLYCITFLGMNYGFRNYYWLFVFLPVVVSEIIYKSNLESITRKIDIRIVCTVVIIVNLAIGLLTSPTIKDVF
ncbi:hypothetical protein BCU81_15055 [Vibrio breoganii]|nr:hypothetical protein BCU81_15055 [Vibrio breoganii]